MNSFIRRVFIFLYTIALVAMLVLPSIKYRVGFMEITVFSLPLIVIIAISSSRYRKSILQIFLCFISMALLNFVFNSRGNVSSLLNLIITLYLCILPYFICRFIIDTKDYTLMRWVTVAICAMLVFIMLRTFNEFSVDPTIARKLAYGDNKDEYLYLQRMRNIGGIGFSYCMGLFVPYMTSLVDRVNIKKKFLVICCLIILMIFLIYTQYTTLLILSVAAIFYVLITQGKLSLKKITAIAVLFVFVFFIKRILWFLASNLSLGALSSHFYDIYYMLSGEGDLNRGGMYLSAFKLFLQNPIFGADLTILDNEYIVSHSHSTFFDRLAGGGLVGVALYYGIFSIIYKSLSKSIDTKYLTSSFIYFIALSFVNPITLPELTVVLFMVLPLIEMLFIKEKEYGIEKRLAY